MIGIRATDNESIALDFPDAKITIEMSIEEACIFATKIGEVGQIAAAQKGMALIIDSCGEPRLVHESVLRAIEDGLDVVLGGEVMRPLSRDVAASDDAPAVKEDQPAG
jgi:hypothetical protein